MHPRAQEEAARSASRPSDGSARKASTTWTRPATSAGSWTTTAPTTSFPDRAGSARACSWTPSRSCSRAAKSCSAAWPSTTAGIGPGAIPVVRLSFGGGNYGRPGQLLARMAEQLADLEHEAGVHPLPRARRHRAASPGCWRRSTAIPGGASWYWWTNTTSRSWTPWTTRRPPRPTATICAGCTARSRNVTPISSSRSSPG